MVVPTYNSINNPIPNLNLHIYIYIYIFLLEYGPGLAAFLLSNALFTTLKQKEVQQRY
jgi:hypothetical protein